MSIEKSRGVLAGLLAVAMCGGGAACGTVSADADAAADHIDAGSTESDAGGSPSDAAPDPDGTPACSAGEICAPAVPEGWTGPVALIPADVQPSCPPERPEVVQATGGAIDVPASTCDCNCGSPSQGSLACDGPLTIHALSSTCDNDVAATTDVVLPEGGQTTDVTNLGATSWEVDLDDHPMPLVTGGECSPSEDFAVPAASLTDTFVTCAPEPGAEGGACGDGGTCLPEVTSLSAPACIYKAGDAECPAGPYTERTVTYQDIEDTRQCSPCTCSEATGTCHGNVQFFGEVLAENALLHTLDGCLDLAFDPTVARLVVDDTDAACLPGGGVLIGEAAPTNTVTTCCLPASPE